MGQFSFFESRVLFLRPNRLSQSLVGLCFAFPSINQPPRACRHPLTSPEPCLREDPKLGRRRFLAAFSQTVRPALARNVFRRGLLESLAPRTQPGQRYHFSCSDSVFFSPYFQGCLAPLSSSAPLHAPPLHAVRNTYGASSSGVWRAVPADTSISRRVLACPTVLLGARPQVEQRSKQHTGRGSQTLAANNTHLFTAADYQQRRAKRGRPGAQVCVH